MKIINTAIASFGMSGQVFHGPCLKVHPGFKICSILERHQSLSRERYAESTLVRSYEAILQDETIELIIVNTPDKFHYDMCKSALEAGKHVLLEKPFTQFSWQAKELMALAEKNNKLLTVYHNRRLDGDFLTVGKILSEGTLGRLVEFESHYDRYRNFIQDSWKEAEDDRNGVLFNLGSHMIDQALVLFGKPASVTAHLRTLRTGGKVFDYYDIRLQYNGFAALLKCSYLVREPGPRYVIHGTGGSFLKWGIDPQEEALKKGLWPKAPDWGLDAESLWGSLFTEENGQEVTKKIETIPGNYLAFYDNLYDAITKGADLMVKAEDALLTMEVLELCLKSNEEKRTIPLPSS